MPLAHAGSGLEAPDRSLLRSEARGASASRAQAPVSSPAASTVRQGRRAHSGAAGAVSLQPTAGQGAGQAALTERSRVFHAITTLSPQILLPLRDEKLTADCYCSL